jgi:hypothetical protein
MGVVQVQGTNNAMTYTLEMASRDSARSLRQLRSYRRLSRWFSSPWYYRLALTWAIITIPIKAIMYNRTAPTVLGGLLAAAITTQVWS